MKLGSASNQRAGASARRRCLVVGGGSATLRMAREHVGAETINYAEEPNVLEALKEMTGGRGPDACIDAVGMEAHSRGIG